MDSNNDLVVDLKEESEGVSEDKKPSIRRPYKRSDFLVFFCNTFLIWYELNTGFEYILNEGFNVVGFVLEICQYYNAMVFFRIVLAIGANIGLKYNYFGKKWLHFVSAFVPSYLIFCVYWKLHYYSMDGQMSDDSRLQIQCTELMLSQIGLIVLMYLKE